jgi:phosphoserine phosphatase RsbU/P
MFQNIQDRLAAQRRNVSSWLSSAPAEEKRLRLGPAGEEAARAHVRVLDEAIGRAADRTLGLCDVCHEPVESGRLEMDYTACVCIDHYTAEQRRLLESELELSARIQQALLPQPSPALPGVDLAVYSRPAAIVGGDFYDFYRFDGGHELAIGDAVGHGLSAGLLVSYLISALRILNTDHDSPAAVLERLNGLFYHSIHLTSFVTTFLARFDSADSGAFSGAISALTYASAGHNPPLLVRRGNGRRPTVRWLEPTGAAIGLVEGYSFREKTVPLRPGDLLLFYTDGVTEAADARDQEFGRERLADVVIAQAHRPAQAIVHAVRQELTTFTANRPPADDLTLVAYRVGG